jgi:hypothetical protein
MNHSANRNGNGTPYSLPSLFRGLYSRVARKLRIDPSYVSRVARGERESEAIARALEVEIRRVSMLASRNGHSQASRDNGSSAGKKAKRTRVRQSR